MELLITGAVAMGFALAALYFLRFWRETHDRLFLLFALSFLTLAINRFALGLQGTPREGYLYWVRFLAFGIILAAIVDKNRSPSSK